jgi:hypothetical protein
MAVRRKHDTDILPTPWDFFVKRKMIAHIIMQNVCVIFNVKLQELFVE